MVDTTRFTDHELNIFRLGGEEARRFRHGTHLLTQDIFKAESPNWKIHVTYDDVEHGVELHVTFKHRYDSAHYQKRVTIPCGTAARAMQRVGRFLEQHKIEEPYCTLDY